MNDVGSLLAFLYGPSASTVAGRVSDLIERWRPHMPRRSDQRGVPGLGQDAALLITYADQLRRDGEAPLHTLAEFCERRLRSVLTGVHVLPFFPSSSDDGFAVEDYLSVDPAFGTWHDIARLAAHFELMFDAVLNHVSAQGQWFKAFLSDDPRYRDFFVTVAGAPDLTRVVRPRALPLLTEFPTAAGPRKIWTTFSADQVDLNYRNPEVLLAVLDALLFYVARGARFIRLDAVAFLWKEIGTTCLHLPQTHAIIQLLRAVLDEVAPGVLLVTETNVPHAENISYFGDGIHEAQLVYNFALPPLVLHSLATGSAQALTRWAHSLEPVSDRVAFFNFLASHDGVGLNPVRGILEEAEIEALVARTRAHGGCISLKAMPDGSKRPYEMNINYLDALSNPAAGESPDLAARKLLCAHGILLSLQGVPGIYFHSLFGSRGDRRGAEISGIARRINREKIECAALEAALDDTNSLRARVFEGQCALLRQRQAHPAFGPAAPQEVLALDARVFAVRRENADGTDRVLCLHNVSGERVRVECGRGRDPIELDGYEVLWRPESRECARTVRSLRRRGWPAGQPACGARPNRRNT